MSGFRRRGQLFGKILEVASGTGQHAEHFARALPSLVWQPSELDAQIRALLEARVRVSTLPNLRAPLAFDVEQEHAPLERVDAVVCIDMIHIAPWSACLALMRHASGLLAPGAPLVLYGPFMRAGASGALNGSPLPTASAATTMAALRPRRTTTR